MGSQDSLELLNYDIQKDYIYMSGYNSGLIRPFLEKKLEEKDEDSTNKLEKEFLSRLLKRQYISWNSWFDVFISRVNR
jgi:hypothetical protein